MAMKRCKQQQVYANKARCDKLAMIQPDMLSPQDRNFGRSLDLELEGLPRPRTLSSNISHFTVSN